MGTNTSMKRFLFIMAGAMMIFLVVNDMGRMEGFPPDARRTSTHEDAPVNNDFALALRESNGFFNDISTREWKLLRERVEQVYPNTAGDPYLRGGPEASAHNFFQMHYEPNFACRHERRIGARGDGGKWVCDPHRIAESERCLVYSVGSSGDLSFEGSIRRDIGRHCEIHVFDVIDDDYNFKTTGAGATFHEWGISDHSFTEKRQVFKTLQQTVQELGHVGRTIDIFKIDCEGCEWDIFPAFFQSGVDLRQILIELHANPISKTRVAIPKMPDFFNAMTYHGYVVFHKEINIQFWHERNCVEYAFLKMNKDFFQNIPELAAVKAVNNTNEENVNMESAIE